MQDVLIEIHPVEPLIKALNDKDDEIRKVALGVLGKIKLRAAGYPEFRNHQVFVAQNPLACIIVALLSVFLEIP
jgi:hypothetical protein